MQEDLGGHGANQLGTSCEAHVGKDAGKDSDVTDGQDGKRRQLEAGAKISLNEDQRRVEKSRCEDERSPLFNVRLSSTSRLPCEMRTNTPIVEMSVRVTWPKASRAPKITKQDRAIKIGPVEFSTRALSAELRPIYCSVLKTPPPVTPRNARTSQFSRTIGLRCKWIHANGNTRTVANDQRRKDKANRRNVAGRRATDLITRPKKRHEDQKQI
jgi:hypothetical protein